MGCTISKNSSPPKNEIKSAAALIRCLATNEDMLYSESIELRIIKALKKINECAYLIPYDSTIYRDVKEAVDTLHKSHPSKYDVFNSYTETILELLKPLDSTSAFETAKKCAAKDLLAAASKSKQSATDGHQLVGQVIILGPSLSVTSSLTAKSMERLQMKSLSASRHDSSMHDSEYGFYDMTSEHG